MTSMFGGMKVIVSDRAVEMAPRFPEKKWSKRRRRRVIGKYGSWTVHRPCVLRTPFGLIVHPKIYAELKRRSTPK